MTTQKRRPRHLRLVGDPEYAHWAYFRTLSGRPSTRPAKTRAPRLLKSGVTYALMPHELAQELERRKVGAAVWALWFEIDHLVFKSRRNPVRLTNTRWGSLRRQSRWQKMRALRQLQKLGLITLSRRGQETHEITCLWRPLS
jgi:hypothetical protein